MSTELAIVDLRATARRGAAFSALLRPETARLPLLVLLAASTRTAPGSAHLLGGALLVLAAYGLAAALNDVHDLDIDRANGRDRPLVDGSLTVADARRAMAGCAVAVVVSQLLLRQPLGLLVATLAVVLSVGYSHPGVAVERRGLWATVLLSVSYVGLPLVLAGPLPGVPPSVAALLAATSMLLYKDVKDELGDRAHGKATPLVRWGMHRMDAVATVLLVAATVLSAIAGPAWVAAPMVGAVAAQRRMVRLDARAGRPLLVFQCLSVAGAMGLAAV